MASYASSGDSRSTRLSSRMKTPSYISYSVTSDPTPGIRHPMASRLSPEARGQEGFEFKGLFLLVLCGLYALLMFVVAKILSYMFSKITAPVKSIFFSASVTEAYTVRKQSMEFNKIKALKVPRVHTRSLCHG